MGYNPQESPREHQLNTMGTLLGVHPSLSLKTWTLQKKGVPTIQPAIFQLEKYDRYTDDGVLGSGDHRAGMYTTMQRVGWTAYVALCCRISSINSGIKRIVG